VAAAVAVCVLTAAGSSVGTWMISREKAKADAAYESEKQRAREARVQAVRAEETLRLARRSVDEMIQVGQDELAGRPGLEGVRKRLLESALVYYQEFMEQRRDDPCARADLAATQDHVRKILADLAVLQGAGQLDLLSRPTVLQDLRVSAEQKERIADLSRRLESQGLDSFRGFRRLSTEERRRRFLDLARDIDAGIRVILTPEQLVRLHQIALQVEGPRAFSDPDVAAALNLTAEQKERLRALEAESPPRRPDGGRGGPPPGGGGPRRDHEPGTSATSEKILAVLTEEQRREWKRMTGEPFKGSGSPGPPPGRFGAMR
jgi:hypothetical protein